MKYLVDSDWLIDYLGNNPEAIRLLQQLYDDGIALSVISYMEALEGIRRVGRAVASTQQGMLEAFELLDVTPIVARRCATLRETLRLQGKRVNQRSLDLLIAATALEYDLTLVTRNLRDYQDIPDLKLLQQGVA